MSRAPDRSGRAEGAVDGWIVACAQIEIDDGARRLDILDTLQEQAQDLNLAEALMRKPERVTEGQVRVNRARRPDLRGDFL